MASDPAVRQEILEAMQPGVIYEAETMGGLLGRLGVACPTSKGRRAVESLFYGHRQVRLSRLRGITSEGRGWQISLRN